MKRLVIQVRKFSIDADRFVEQRKLSNSDLEELERRLVENPEEGDLVPGTGGLRKTRLRSFSGGKSGGFRVCYCDLSEKERLYLILIYAKNMQENLSSEEKKILKELIEKLKKE